MGAWFYRARFSMNGLKNKLAGSIVYTSLCRDMVQTAVNILQMEGDVV